MTDPTAPTAGMDGRTVLVTGGAGFIGSHIVAALAGDNEVRVLDDCSTGDPERVPEEATLIRGDVTDPEVVAEAVAGVDVVFHHAAIVSVEQSVEDPAASHRTNVDGTLAVLEAAREADARVVLASSAAVYGDPAELPATEETRTEPLSPYGADKLAADVYARVYADVYDLPVVVLRYFNVYGPGQHGPYSGVVDAFLERALADDSLAIHGDGEQTRDFVHVFDVVRANLAAATTDHVGEAFNVGTGESVTVTELADEICRAVGVDPGRTHEPPRAGDVRHSRSSTARARSLLEFRPGVDLREGIEHLVKYRRGEAPARPTEERGPATESGGELGEVDGVGTGPSAE